MSAVVAGLPPCDLLARLTGRPVLALDLDGTVVAAGGARGLRFPSRVGSAVDLRRMAGSTIATPATWHIDGREWRVFGMRWPSTVPRILVRLVPRESTPFHVVSERLAALESRQIQVRAALGRALVAEAETEATAEQLRRTNRDLEHYAALVAHDLRAPLRTARLLAGRVAAVAREDGDPALVTELAARLDGTLGRLDDLVLRLLDYASLDDHGLAIARVDAPSLVAGVLDDLRGLLDEHGVTVSTEVTGALDGDLDLLATVVRELVVNAVKHRAADRTCVVVIRGRSCDAGYELSVTDTGVGVPPELREQAFGMFQRLRTESSEGLGFGLAYCRRIVELHAGSIELTGEADALGATVRMRLPVMANA